jgi:hypothetical protein
VKKIKSIDDLTPDARNANAHSERGTGLVEHSLRECGAGRSIVVDKHGNVIAGNATLESFASIADPEQIIVVPTNGTKLVVVQRVDLDLDKDKRARELAVLDNRVAEVNLNWDGAVLAQLADEYGFSSDGVGFSDSEFNNLFPLADAGDAPEPKQITCPHCGETFPRK